MAASTSSGRAPLRMPSGVEYSAHGLEPPASVPIHRTLPVPGSKSIQTPIASHVCIFEKLQPPGLSVPGPRSFTISPTFASSRSGPMRSPGTISRSAFGAVCGVGDFSWAAAEIAPSAVRLKVASFISGCRRFRIFASTIDRSLRLAAFFIRRTGVRSEMKICG